MGFLAVAILAFGVAALGCGSDGEVSRGAGEVPKEKPNLPMDARRVLKAQPDVRAVHCSARKKFIEHAYGSHPLLDTRTLPERVCVVERPARPIVDYFYDEGAWFSIPRALEAAGLRE